MRTFLRGVGQTLITAGVVILLFCVYELEITGIYTHREQARLHRELIQQWAAPPPPGNRHAGLPLGSGIAVIHIPALGADYQKVVVEGVAVEDLKRGPGHYPGTALPGQVGNMVISGHRTTYGAPFNQVDRLRPGDAIVLETRDTYFTYRVTGLQVVTPTSIEVTYPVPFHRGALPTQRLLTLTTCNPKYSAAQRLIVHALFEAPFTKQGDLLPPALRKA
ncbi:MAG: class E sortase [Actinomycetota bacterium]|nr:class E sortase [Actinomycetota bacterium]